MKHKFFKTKHKRLKIIAIFTVLLLIVGYACEDSLRHHWEQEKQEAREIAFAKDWYEKNKPESMGLRSADGRELIPMKAEWTHVFATQYENFEVVETDLMSQGRLIYLDNICKEMHDETNDSKYQQCYTRIVFRTDRKTNTTVGFLMTVVPDMEWLRRSNFKPFMEVTYLFRSKHFGGMVLFHELDGRFSNGWVYEDGRIVATVGSMDANPNEALFRSTVCNITSIPCYQQQCVGFSTMNEDGSYNDYLTCTNVVVGYSYITVCYDDGYNGNDPSTPPPPGGGGYTGGPGTPPPPSPPPPPTQTNNPCSNGAAGSALNNNMVANSTVKTNMDNVLNDKAKYSATEWAVSIGQNNNGYSVSGALEGTGTNGTIPPPPQGTTYVASGHNHPKGDMGVPSSGDLYRFLQLVKDNPSMQTMYVYGTGYKVVNGTTVTYPETYAINIYDRAAAIAFLNAYPASSNLMNGQNGWVQGTDLYKQYYDAQKNYSTPETDPFTGDAAALAYIMDFFNMGVTLTRSADNGAFKVVNSKPPTAAGAKYIVSNC